MFGVFFTEREVHSFEDAKTSDLDKFSRYHRGMLERGIYLAPSQFEAGFTSLAHTDEDINQTLKAADEVMATL
jgi:glutamate-1-semialdehyde 2,1-aminomutase